MIVHPVKDNGCFKMAITKYLYVDVYMFCICKSLNNSVSIEKIQFNFQFYSGDQRTPLYQIDPRTAKRQNSQVVCESVSV